MDSVLEQIKLVCELHKGNGYCGASKVLLGEDVQTKAECVVKIVNLDADARQVYQISESLASRISESQATSACAASSAAESPYSPKRDLCSAAHHELNVLRSLKHPNVVTIFGTCMVSSYLYFYFELLEFGSIRDVLDLLNYGLRPRVEPALRDATDQSGVKAGVTLKSEELRGIPEFAIAYIVRGVLHALRYLHSAGIIHRSVRPAHILLGSPHRVVLSGFELAYRYTPLGASSELAADTAASASAATNLQSIRCFDYSAALSDGLSYAAPEFLAQDQRGYNALADVYSLGVCAAEMWNGVAPFGVELDDAANCSAEPLSILAAKARNETPHLRGDGSEDAGSQLPMQKFVDLCCAAAEERASVDGLLKSEWLTEYCQEPDAADADADTYEAERKLANLADAYSVWLADCAQPLARRARSRQAAARLNATDGESGRSFSAGYDAAASQELGVEFEWTFA